MNPMPKPLLHKLVLTLLVGTSCFLVGLLFFLSSRDKILFVLSSAILIFSCIRSLSLYLKIKSGNYFVLEGTCVSVSRLPLQRTCKVILTDRKGDNHFFFLPKDCKLLSGHSYRLYFQCSPDSFSQQNSMLEKIYLSGHLLGIEPLTNLQQDIETNND